MSRFDDLSLAWLRSKKGLKWGTIPSDMVAAWVADMDFPPPGAVTEALVEEVEAGDLGYPAWIEDRPLEGLFERRMTERHGWAPRQGRTRVFTDVLNALQAMLFLVTEPGDAIAVHSPTYPPFLDTFSRMGLSVRTIRFRRSPAGWMFDEDEAKRAIEGARVLLIVNPHNPTGRVLRKSELDQLVAPAIERGLLVVSDEVHSDLVYPGRRHIPTASISPEAADQTVTLTSATKAFNLAGIRCAIAHIGHEGVWKTLNELPENLFGVVGNLGVVATEAAWERGDPWLEASMRTLDGNRRRLAETLNRLAPSVMYVPPEATYLAWLDFRRTPLPDDPAAVLEAKGRVKLSPGPAFGEGGRGHARLNFATSGPLLDAALIRIASVLEAS